MTDQLMPTAFVGHGNPMNALGGPIAEGWEAWGRSLPRPEAILVVSAHFERHPPTLSSTTGSPLVYDFFGFPEEMYRLSYASPPAPALADVVEHLLAPELTVARDEGRGLDHGAWVPLMRLFPTADVPVVQLSIPWTDDPAEMLALGARLAPLRGDGVLILGSGNLVHNLRRVDWHEGRTPAWAADFDAWVAQALAADRAPDLAGYRTHELAAVAHPTHEHFVPVLVAAGAATGEQPVFPVEGFELGSVSARSVQFGLS
jgi:4,5-DOPA dioxygenase extradiol